MQNFYSGPRQFLRFSSTLCIFLFMEASSQDSLVLNSVIRGLSAPIQFVNAGDGSKRIFIAEKTGAVKLFDAGYNSRGIFLTVDGIATNGERGLLSIAFHPNFRNNGYVYTYYTATSGNLEIARYHISDNPDRADPASRTVILTIPHPGQSNHNGGELHFGPDGHLYLSTGDGGGSGDPGNNAQSGKQLLGKILRIDVDHPDAGSYYSIPAGNPFNNEIFALGLRNPFRWSFDRQTGDIWIGDAGQDTWEEIDYIKSPAGGENFGWRCYEGSAAYNNNNQCSSNYQRALYAYPTADPAASVIGGVVYRGNRFPSLQGYYIAADYFSGNFYKINSEGTATIQQNLARNIADFGENEDGEVFAVSLSAGTVSMIMDVQDAPLPVKLTSFRAIPGDRDVNLYWSTSSELNTVSYNVEFSGDGNNYTVAGTVAASGEPAGSNYEFVHSLVQPGTIYYRLKIIDADGRYDYSNILVVQIIGNREGGFVYPSVIKRGSTLTAFIPGNFNTLEIINVSGAMVRRENLGGRTGRVGISLASLPSGIYSVQLKNRDKTLVQKIVILD